MKVNWAPPNITSFLPGQQGASVPSGNTPIPAPPSTVLPTIAPAPIPSPFTNLQPIQDRLDMANQAIAEGSSTAPAQGGIGAGLARLGEAALGGYLKRGASADLTAARNKNKQAVMDAFDQGNMGQLITSDDPVAQKLGSAILEMQMKRQSGPKLLSDQDKATYGFNPQDVVQHDPIEGFKILNPRDSKPLVSNGMISSDNGKTWSPIQGYVDNAKAVGDAKRKPVTADDSTLPPWERKW